MDLTLPATGLVVGLLIGLTGIGGGALKAPPLQGYFQAQLKPSRGRTSRVTRTR